MIRNRYAKDSGVPLVSVITPCYNYCGAYLSECVASVAGQTYGNIEHVILHCNCGTPTPIDLPTARNRIIRQAAGDYILPLDADDIFKPEAAAEMMRHRDRADVISCLQEDFGDRRFVFPPPDYSQLNFDGFLHHNRIHCASLFRKSMWRDLGGYDEGLVAAYEDWDFWLRAAQARKTFFVVGQALFRYRRHAGSMTARVGETNALKKFRAKWPLAA